MKPWYRSKTVWVNLAFAALAIVEVNLRVLQPALGNWYGVAVIALPLANLFLRFVTTQGVSLGGKA